MRKFLHLAKLFWAYRIRRASELNYPPYQFTIEPTNVCNLECPFCPQSDPLHAGRRKTGTMTAERLGRLLEHIAVLHPGNSNINFTLDGEPFINREFVTFVEMAASRGFFSIFASNGTYLDPPTADRLISAGPFRASIDFAATREVFESIRGRAGDFDKVLGNLRYLMEQSRRYPVIHLDVNDISSYAGADPDASLAQMRALFPADLPSRIRFTSRIFHNFCGHLPMPKERSRYRLCPYPWTQLAVTHSGDCVACCRDSVGRTVLGNVFEQSIAEIWNGAEYRKLRQNLIDGHPELNAACKDCDLPWSGGQKRWRLSYVIRSLLER